MVFREFTLIMEVQRVLSYCMPIIIKDDYYKALVPETFYREHTAMVPFSLNRCHFYAFVDIASFEIKNERLPIRSLNSLLID